MKKNIFTGVIILIVILLIILGVYAFQNSNSETSENNNSEELSLNEEQQSIDSYIKNNIGELSPEEPAPGESFNIISIEYPSDNSAIVNYEDGQISLTAELDFEIHENNEVEIKNFEITNQKPSNSISESFSSDVKESIASYIENNIETLSPESPESGSSFSVSTIKYPSNNTAIVEYGDGYSVITAEANYEINENDEVKVVSFYLMDVEKINQEE